MNTNIKLSIENPQNINDVNGIFEQLTNSRSNNISKNQGRLYFVIDVQTSMIGLTSDKKNASPLKNVASWINDFTQKTLVSSAVQREEIRILRERYYSFEHKLLPQTLFQKILNFLFGYKTEKAVFRGFMKEVVDTLDKGLSNYGKRERSRTLVDFSNPDKPIRSDHLIVSSIDYATYGASQSNEHLQMKVKNTFEETKNLGKFNTNTVTDAFNDELAAKLNPNWSSDKAMHTLVTGVFEDLLNQFSDKPFELSPKQLLVNFKLDLKTTIDQKNHVRELVDRDTFRDLMGIKVNDGKKKSASDIDLSSPQVKKLIKEYNDGSWLSEEEKILEYDIMKEDDKKKLHGILEPIINSEAFDETLLEYFESMK